MISEKKLIALLDRNIANYASATERLNLKTTEGAAWNRGAEFAMTNLKDDIENKLHDLEAESA